MIECKICQNGVDPTKGKRMGRCFIRCEDCGRDLTIAAILLADAIIDSTEENPCAQQSTSE
jgi:hypothetical protein